MAKKKVTQLTDEAFGLKLELLAVKLGRLMQLYTFPLDKSYLKKFKATATENFNSVIYACDVLNNHVNIIHIKEMEDICNPKLQSVIDLCAKAQKLTDKFGPRRNNEKEFTEILDIFRTISAEFTVVSEAVSNFNNPNNKAN